MSRAWNNVWPTRGSALRDPAVLQLFAEGPSKVLRQRRIVEGRNVVVTRRTRVYLDRNAWELLSPDDLLFSWVVPSIGENWAWVMTVEELEAVFGEVRDSGSWDQVRCYHFPHPPLAVEAFRVS